MEMLEVCGSNGFPVLSRTQSKYETPANVEDRCWWSNRILMQTQISHSGTLRVAKQIELRQRDKRGVTGTKTQWSETGTASHCKYKLKPDKHSTNSHDNSDLINFPL